MADSETVTISAAAAVEGKANGTLIVDDRRRRPLWFDGRYLQAETLTREQQYFISRQNDIARVTGVGVIYGLRVELLPELSRAVLIKAGQGITPSGQLVTLVDDLEIDLTDVEENQELDLSFGISVIPSQPMVNRSGIFIVALRPVEFSAVPLASYPTEIDGTRSVEDSSVIEATAITLIPYADQGASTEIAKRQKHVAKEIFVDDSQKGQPRDVLPLAIIALNMGVIEWMNADLVRREVTQKDHDIFGLGLSPRTLRQAHLLQYQSHLKEVMQGRQSGSSAFPAAEEFLAVPPAGPMPAASINIEDFSQMFFPVEMHVELSIIPDDELYSMIEESLALPPIDLTLGSEAFESTSVLIMLPVPRHQMRKLSLTLESLIVPLKSVALNTVSQQNPIDALRELGKKGVEATETDLDAIDTVWKQALQSVGATLWYTRRRNLPYKAEIAGEPIELLRDEQEQEEQVIERVEEINLTPQFQEISERSTQAARAETLALLGSLKGPKTMLRGAVNELHAKPSINRFAVLNIRERFSKNRVGEGVARLEKEDASFVEDEAILTSIGKSKRVPELDRLVLKLPKPELRVFAQELISTIRTGEGVSEDRVARLIDDKSRELQAPFANIRQ